MGRCSVISPRSQVPKIWDPDSRRHVGGDGEICEALFIPENEFFILSDDSSRVNVRIDAEPRIFVSSEGPGSVQLAIIGEFGFYLPGDIRATKVEVA